MMSANTASWNTHSMNRGNIIEKPSSHKHYSHIFKLNFFLTNSSKYFLLTHLHRSNNSMKNKKPKQIENLYSKNKKNIGRNSFALNFKISQKDHTKFHTEYFPKNYIRNRFGHNFVLASVVHRWLRWAARNRPNRTMWAIQLKRRRSVREAAASTRISEEDRDQRISPQRRTQRLHRSRHQRSEATIRLSAK